MMYNYKIGYYSHEESDYVELQHEKKFSDDEDFLKFYNLAKKWKEETLIASSVNVIESNPSYLEIIKMERKVLSHIFHDLKSDHAFWFHALEEITGCNPIKYAHRGYVDLMAEDWLKWGEEHKYV